MVSHFLHGPFAIIGDLFGINWTTEHLPSVGRATENCEITNFINRGADQNMNRPDLRSALRGRTDVSFLLVVIPLISSVVSTVAAEPAELNARDERINAARRQVAQRTRRIIYNDDGGAIVTGRTTEEFLEVRIRQIANTQVDTVFHNTGQTTVFQHSTKVAETIDGAIAVYGSNAHGQRQAGHIISLRQAGTDSITLTSEFCRRNSIEYFWSLRMNDIHDALPGEIWRQGRWKHEHRDLLLGRPGDWDLYPAHDPHKWWTAMDFARSPVREYLYRIIEEVCEQYDVDGIELDWWRSPLFFRPTLTMQPVEQTHLDIMNDFVRRIRAMTEQVAEKRGRPLLVAARVPMSVERSRAIGLDLKTWLEEDLVDMLTGGCGYAPRAMGPAIRRLVEFARPCGVPVYACISGSGIRGDTGTERPDDRIVDLWRGAAMNIWHAGASGVYTFNYCPQYRDERFIQMGSVESLRGLDKIYAIDNIQEPTFEGDLRPGLVVPHRLPLKLSADGDVTARLPVGENIAAGTPAGKKCYARLRLRLTGLFRNDVVSVNLNDVRLGEVLPDMDQSDPDGSWIEFEPDPGQVSTGTNLVRIRVKTNQPGGRVLHGVELLIRYR